MNDYSFIPISPKTILPIVIFFKATKFWDPDIYAQDLSHPIIP
jgi:hypothetical protein